MNPRIRPQAKIYSSKFEPIPKRVPEHEIYNSKFVLIPEGVPQHIFFFICAECARNSTCEQVKHVNQYVLASKQHKQSIENSLININTCEQVKHVNQYVLANKQHKQSIENLCI